METLKHNLKVIDHLRNYRPKRQTHRQSAHRPVFSFPSLGGYTPGQEKAVFTFGLGGGEKQELLTRGTRSGTTPYALSDDEGHAGDIEEGVSARSKKGKARKSWVFPSGFSRRSTAIDGLPAVAPADQPYQHTYPPANASPEQGNDSPRSGRTTPQPRRSSEEEPAIVVQAAKALRTAVLHDARNLTGKNEVGAEALGWSVNSAHEAKVLLRMSFSENCPTLYHSA